MTFSMITGLAGLLIWLSIALLPWRPWSTRESLDSSPDNSIPKLTDLTVIIPARNEAEQIAETLQSVIQQGIGHKIVVVDDESTDNTHEIANQFSAEGVEVLKGRPAEAGWYGKLWALEQGRLQANTQYILCSSKWNYSFTAQPSSIQ